MTWLIWLAWPRPGMAKRFSMITEPPNRAMNWMPSTDTTGTLAYRRACTYRIRQVGVPTARSVRMCSCRNASRIPAQAVRATIAAPPTVSVSTGITRLSAQPTGSVGECDVAGGRQQLALDRQHVDEQDADPERRQGQRDAGSGVDDPGQPAAADGGGDAEDDADDAGQQRANRIAMDAVTGSRVVRSSPMEWLSMIEVPRSP